MKKLAIALCLMAFVLIGCDKGASAKSDKKEAYAIGEMATLKGINVTVNGTRMIEGNQYIKPEAGTQWIAVDMTFENTGKESQYISGIFEVKMKDAEGKTKEATIFADIDNKLEGNVLPGEKLKGEVVYVITGDETALNLYYNPTLALSDPIKFIIK